MFEAIIIICFLLCDLCSVSCSGVFCSGCSMYLGIEFAEADGGGISLVHEKWLTPRKSNVWWPPFKQNDKFEKCLRNGASPNENWSLFSIERTYFKEDNCEKAKIKLRKAEVTSEITSEDEEEEEEISPYLPPKRQRQPNKRLIYDSDSEEESRYPLPPKIKTPVVFTKAQVLQPNPQSVGQKKLKQVNLNLTQEESSRTDNQTFINKEVGLTPEAEKSKFLSNEKSEFKTLLEQIIYVKKQNEEILNILRSSNSCNKSQPLMQPELPVSLPLKNVHDLNLLEGYLVDPINFNLMVQFCSSFGGRDINNRTNILLRYFMSNNLATQYSFFGTRNEKNEFSKLKLRTLIVTVALKALNTTETEVNNAVKVWLKHAPKRLAAQERKLHSL